jgi:hypothetical protein
MWLCAEFRPTAAFSLRSSMTTSSGGKTNLVPTMYAVKLAMVSAALEAGEDGARVFELLRSLPIRFRPPERVVVSNTLVRVLRETRTAGEVYGRTVGFREFCFYQGDLGIAFDLERLPADGEDALRRLLPLLAYFGKRGSFFQYLGATAIEAPDAAFGYVSGDRSTQSATYGVLQYLDDIGDRAGFAALNTYDPTAARLGRDRILVPVLLPYRQVGSSRGYTSYVRSV